MELARKLIAEVIGTGFLVLGGCGAAVLAAGEPGVGIGWLGVAIAFGLTVMAMAYGVGHISGCHLNPAVSAGLTIAGRLEGKLLFPYVGAQLVGGILGAAILFYIAGTKEGFTAGGFASNGYGEHSPGGYPLAAVLLAEAVATFIFVLVILGATDKRALRLPRGSRSGCA